jgi:hypothetical protein
MSPAEYKAAVRALGFSSQAKAGAWLGMSRRQCAAYARGEAKVPQSIVMLMRLCIKLDIKPQDLLT